MNKSNEKQHSNFYDIKRFAIILIIRQTVTIATVQRYFPNLSVDQVESLIRETYDLMKDTGLYESKYRKLAYIIKLVRLHNTPAVERVAVAKCLTLFTEKNTDCAYQAIIDLFFDQQ